MNAELDLLVSLGDYDRPQEVADRAVQAEELGFDRITVGETTGWDIVPPLTLAADRTDELGISTNVISPYSRTPAMLAQTALTLQAAADGRYRFGIGPSSPAITERWHGMEFDRPLRRTRETIEIMRRVYDEGNPAYEGDVFDVPGLGYERGPTENPPPIDLGTLGPKATEMAGRFGDGWAPQMFTADGLRDRLEDLERGVELADKDRSDLRVAPIVRVIAGEDRQEVRQKARGAIAFMLGAYGPYYGNSVAEQGYPDVVSEIRAAWQDRNTDAMAAALPDEVLDELAAAGTPDEVREWIEAYGEIDGVDAVQIGFINGISEDEKHTTMETVADLG
ncbi:TIGR04024 family LLM class F420-dependent oxidoreductase [Natrinema halophilum]|uniref:TIGR04024 family LLM class F420-dependent oxidoreductase n=1 Tax=Natrinema halophilum TaxID=1699371 RepID=A0A7D5KX12_9EURY|nr:TIGR04024 family LLM class F420-dependent oxidoreductase [Natrinema halophilum]QLG48342.1 TIGR04024 family LLM class F420-dependent oxidoreductase [Natrinema halophilum]